MYRLGKDVHVFQEKWILTIIDQELIYMYVLFRLQYYHIMENDLYQTLLYNYKLMDLGQYKLSLFRLFVLNEGFK